MKKITQIFVCLKSSQIHTNVVLLNSNFVDTVYNKIDGKIVVEHFIY